MNVRETATSGPKHGATRERDIVNVWDYLKSMSSLAFLHYLVIKILIQLTLKLDYRRHPKPYRVWSWLAFSFMHFLFVLYALWCALWKAHVFLCSDDTDLVMMNNKVSCTEPDQPNYLLDDSFKPFKPTGFSSLLVVPVFANPHAHEHSELKYFTPSLKSNLFIFDWIYRKKI